MRLERCLSLADFEPLARRRLPKGLYGFIAGAAEDGRAARDSARAFDRWAFAPRVLTDTSARTAATALFGRAWAAPFGIAPMGACGVAAFEADLALARAAASADIPFVLSSASLVAMERVIRANPRAWFQLYASPVDAENATIVARAADAGFDTLVLTVDVPVGGNREDDVRNGYRSPLRPTARLAFDAIVRPRWFAGTLVRTLVRDGMPSFENLPGARVPMISRHATRTHRRDRLAWSDVDVLRDRWRGRLVLKGVLAPDDVRRARAAGVDGVILSNHGGRQLDRAIAPLDALATLGDAAGGMPVLIDGALRRGTDVLTAVGLGAAFAFVGRPMLYAAVAGGEAGVARAIAILRQEIERDLALLGCRAPDEVVGRVVPARAADDAGRVSAPAPRRIRTA